MLNKNILFTSSSPHISQHRSQHRSRQRALTLLALLCSILFITTGCVSPYLKVHRHLDEKHPVPALMTSARIYRSDHDPEARKSLIETAVAISSNLDLGGAGEKMINQAQEGLKSFGIHVHLDPKRAQKLDQISSKFAKGLNEAAQIFQGTWTSPQGAQTARMRYRQFTFDSTLRKIAQTLRSNQEEELFLFISAQRSTDTEWLFLQRSQVILYYRLIDQTGQTKFEGVGIGHGLAKFGLGENDIEGLHLALEKAHYNMMRQPRQSL